MHILINGHFWFQPNVGSGQYVHGLAHWLPLVAPQHRYTLLLPANGCNTPMPPIPQGTQALTLRTPFDGRNTNLAKLWFEQVGVPHVATMLHRTGTEKPLVHVPYFAPPLHCCTLVVTTIPDIIPLLLPAYAGGVHVRAYMHLVRRAIHSSDHVITFSQQSRNDSMHHMGIPAERITTILLAASERYKLLDDYASAQQQVATHYGLQEPFIYYVGGLDVRKNVAILLHALAYLRQEDQHSIPLTLAIAGQPLSGNRRLFPDIDGLSQQLGVADCVRRISVPYEDGPLLYQACTAFAFPSRYEGFGLPPLEAMACGAPVIVSNASSLPEVVGNAALCVAPDDVAGWATALRQIVEDADLRRKLRSRGLAQSARFSWHRVAKETLQVYESVHSL